MEHLTASTSPLPFSGEDWFDPLEDAIRFRVRAFIEALVEEEAQAALGGHKRYQRNGRPKGYRNGHRLAASYGKGRDFRHRQEEARPHRYLREVRWSHIVGRCNYFCHGRVVGGNSHQT